MSKQSQTDWKALEAMTDKEIDYSDIPPLTDSFFERAKLWRPQKKVTVTMRLDSDILEWFQAQDRDWEKRVQAALRIYIEAHKELAISDTR
jgi:uncharacterized protein (DUF4415 family)